MKKQSNHSALMQGSIRVKIGVKEVHLGQRMRYALIITNQNLQVLDLIHEDVSAIISRISRPRGAKISKCERFIVAQFADSTVGIYSTADGSQLSKIMGVPRSTGNFVISGNSQRLLFANNQTLCLWSIPKGELEITSNQWRNINCYAIRDDAKQIAIGTYSGALLILTLLTTQRVTQMQVKKHSNCVMMIGYTKFGEIISVSYDKYFIKTTICDLAQGGKGISYDQIIMQTLPRSIKAVGNIVFFIESEGSIGWITNGYKMMQYSDGIYSATECEGRIIFMKYKQGLLQWFQAQS